MLGSPAKLKKTCKYPSTWEAEYERVEKIAKATIDKVDNFLENYTNLASNTDYESCAENLLKLYSSFNIHETDIETLSNFQNFIRSKRLNNELINETELTIFENICKQSDNFEKYHMKWKNTIQRCLKHHVYKFFSCFSEHCPEVIPPFIKDVQSQYEEYKTQLNRLLSNMQHQIDTYYTIVIPFIHLVRNGKLIEETIRGFANDLKSACIIIKQWVTSERGYGDALFASMKAEQNRVKQLTKNVQRVEEKREAYRAVLNKQVRERCTIRVDYDESRRRKQRLSYSTETVKLLIGKTREDIEDKKKEVKYQNNLSAPNIDSGFGTPNFARLDLDKLEDRLHFLERQNRRMKHTYKRVSDRTYEIKMDVHTNEQEQNDTLEKISQCDKEITMVTNEIEKLRRETEAMRQVRELKLTNDTLRRIALGRLATSVTVHPVDKACKFVAENIGHDWNKLYMQLPFIPLREASRRQRDIDTISYLAARHDQTPDEQARSSLDKWRNFHRQPLLSELLRSLRLIEKTDLARQVDRRYNYKAESEP